MKFLLLTLIMFNFCVADFIRDNNNNIILDTSTNLIWQDNNNVNTTTYTWESAISYCEGLTIDSYSNWRVPNINELISIIDDSLYEPSINSKFQNTKSNSDGKYWTSTTRASATDNAWYILFQNGPGNILIY